MVYDFSMGGNYMPNCLDQTYTEIIFENYGQIMTPVMDFYYKNCIQIPNLVEGLNVSEGLFENITLYDYDTLDIDKENSIFLYPVEPYANMDHVLGTPHSFSKEPFLKHISKKALTELQKENNNFYLIVSFANEGTISNNMIDYLYNIVDAYSVPRYKLIFVIASADLDTHHERFCERENVPSDNRIKTLYWTWSLREKVEEAHRIERDQNTNIDGSVSTIATESDLDENKKRNHKFMMFNRRMRVQRVILLCLLGLDFIEENLISYDFNFLSDPVHESLFEPRVDKKYVSMGVQNMQNIIDNKKKSVIDFNDVYNTIGFGCEIKDPYIDSYIHIISETNFEIPGVYFSEKTWKPILNLQPFIMVNYAHSLKYLKDIGFKTFHPFIDESYDSEEDDSIRMTKIYEEIKRLNSLSIDELHNWYYGIKDILIYNRNHALSFRGDKLKQTEIDYLNKIIDYVESNQTN